MEYKTIVSLDPEVLYDWGSKENVFTFKYQASDRYIFFESFTIIHSLTEESNKYIFDK